MREAIKRIDAATFAAHAAEYVAAGEPLDIEQDGRVIGRYRPTPVAASSSQASAPPNGHAPNGSAHRSPEDAIRPESRETIARLDELIDDILARTGMTEEEFASYFDMTKPFPYDKVAES